MIISFINNKGGVLKTTMATNIASAIAKSQTGSRVVIVDLDGQGNVSATFGQHPERLKNTLIDVFRKKKSISDCVLTCYTNLDILPCNFELSFVDIDVATANMMKQKKKPLSPDLYTSDDIKNVIRELDKNYDYVILDTPPTMATIVSICLSISNLVVIPFEPDQYSLLGLMRIVDTISDFKKKNSNLRVLVVPTKVSARVRLHVDVINLIKQKLKPQSNITMSKNIVSLTTKPAASVGYERIPIVLSASKTKYHEEYNMITEEIIDQLNAIKKGK